MGLNKMFLPQPIQKKVAYCTLQDGVKLCEMLHKKLSPKGFFPALTGGLLYKGGNRKDIDIVIYRHRQQIASFETVDLMDLLLEIGVEITGVYGFVTKAKWNGFIVDIFNPETSDTENEINY